MSSFSNIFPRSSSFFPNKDSIFSQASFRVFSPSRWSKWSREMWTHMKLIQKLVLLNILLGLSFSTHCHPKHTKLAEGYLHFYPPITVVEGCKDSGYESWRIHLFVFWNNQFLKKLHRYLQITQQNQNQFAIILVSSLSSLACTISESPSHLDRLLRI